MKFQLYKPVLWFQGIYTLVTALWGLVDIDSFMKVTGPKNDIWLVKTVSAILAAVGLTFISFALQKEKNASAAVLAITSAIALAGIDFHYSSHRVISPVYAVDGVLQCLFILSWIFILYQWKKR
jgi:hypothetical protein